MKVACSCNACQSCWTLGRCHTLCDELAWFHDFREHVK